MGEQEDEGFTASMAYVCSTDRVRQLLVFYTMNTYLRYFLLVGLSLKPLASVPVLCIEVNIIGPAEKNSHTSTGFWEDIRVLPVEMVLISTLSNLSARSHSPSNNPYSTTQSLGLSLGHLQEVY